MVSNYILLRAAGNTYRLDIKTGVTSRFMMTAGYSWTNIIEMDPPTEDSFDIAEVAGDKIIRINCKTGKSWMMVTKSLQPEWQSVVK